MYKIGDKIVYPMHGAGIIQGIEEKKVLKEKKSYYIMKMPVGDMMIMIPTNNHEEIGVRYIIDTKTAKNVIEKFDEETGTINENWNKRYRENMIKIRSGDILEVLQVVKSLMIRDKERGLSTGERKMLSNAKQILFSELVLAKAAVVEEIEQMLDAAIEKQMVKKL